MSANISPLSSGGEAGNVGTTLGGATSVVALLTGLGAVFPFVGQILGAIGIKTGTTHPDATQCNAIADPFADRVYAAVQAAAPSSQWPLIGKKYREKMLAYLPNLNRWRNQDSWAPRSVPIRQITNEVVLDDPYYTIRNVTRFYAVWAARNSDAQRPQDFVNVTREDLTETLVKAYEEVTGRSAAGAGIETGSGGSTGSGAATGTVGMASFTPTETVLTLAALGGLLFFFTRPHK